jgi:hypothetical protein
MWETIQLIVVAVIVLAPMWIFANELGADEFVKSAVGIAGGAVVFMGMRILEKRFNHK